MNALEEDEFDLGSFEEERETTQTDSLVPTQMKLPKLSKQVVPTLLPSELEFTIMQRAILYAKKTSSIYLVQIDRKTANVSQVLFENERLDLELEPYILGAQMIIVLRSRLPANICAQYGIDLSASQILLVCTDQINLSKASSSTARFANKCREIKDTERFFSGKHYMFTVVPQNQVNSLFVSFYF